MEKTEGEYLNYEEDVAIDSTALDVEWLQQPDLMRKYAKHAADMKREMDDAKERQEMVRASMDLQIRNDPARFGLDKITEGAIQSTIIQDPQYTAATNKYSAAKYEYEVASAVVRAIDQRKAALENLVRLLGLSYFAGPQSPRDLHQEQLKEKERKMKNAKVKITQRKRRPPHGNSN